MDTKRGTHDGGFALLVVLWAMVMLAFLVTHVTAAGRTEARVAGNLRGEAEAEALADSAVHQTLFHLLADGAQHWAPGGQYRLPAAGGEVRVAVDNLTGRVNPNVASPELLRALLTAIGATPYQVETLSDGILDWRTPGRAARPHGAKAPEYRAAGRDYGPPELPFRSLDELGAVLGMTPALLAQLRPHLTLAWEEDPEPAFADPVVLAALRSLGAADPAGGQRPTVAVSITATAAVAGGGRFTRHAEMVFNTAAPGLAWRILAWDAPG